MRLPRVILVTGTDTGVGKTVVSAALAVALSGQGPVAVYKPVQAGLPADADEVRRLTGLDSVFEGARLEAPLNPTTAARLRGVKLPSLADHAERIELLLDDHRTVVVEGAGGLLVGLDNDGRGIIDLSEELDLPHTALVVARAGLGTLNHSMLTVRALRAAQVPVHGLVIGAWPAEPGLAEQCNADDLPELTGLPIVGQLPAGAGDLTPDAFRAAAPSWFHP